MPSFAPSKKVSKTLFLCIIPYMTIIKIITGIAKFESTLIFSNNKIPFSNTYFPILIKNLTANIPTTPAQIVAIQTGTIIIEGLVEPKELLIAITVDGII